MATEPSDFATCEAIRRDIARVVISRDRIARRVGELAEQIADCYGSRELTILAVLTGSLIFLADLVRSLPLVMRLDVTSVCSYPGDATRPSQPRLDLPPRADLAGKDVLILDDILDSGGTLRLLTDTLRRMSPASLRSCVLLRKNRPDLPDRLDVDFVGFDLDDEFVVGYGLDYNHLYRNLPDICLLSDRALSGNHGGRQP